MKLDPLTISDQDILAHIGQNLRQAREQVELSTGDVAQQLALKSTQIEQIESGKEIVDVTLLYRLSMLYGLKPGECFGGLPGLSTAIPMKEKDVSHLVQNFLKVDQPNRGQLFKDFVSDLSGDGPRD